MGGVKPKPLGLRPPVQEPVSLVAFDYRRLADMLEQLGEKQAAEDARRRAK
jgi:hypothetical protein